MGFLLKIGWIEHEIYLFLIFMYCEIVLHQFLPIEEPPPKQAFDAKKFALARYLKDICKCNKDCDSFIFILFL